MEFVRASSYTTHGNLAHRPKGTPAKHPLSMFELCQETGRLTLLTVVGSEDTTLQNCAFLRGHPTKNLLYCVTESIQEEGLLVAFSMCSGSGRLREVARMGTFGRSSCYITLARDLTYLYVVNYWDSTMLSVPLDANGLFIPKGAHKTVIPGPNSDQNRVQHGDDPHSTHRLKESHAHAIVFEPSLGKLAYIPDLGEGCIKQFIFDHANKDVRYLGPVACARGDSGPRYLEFHPKLNVVYCVNELANSIQVYRFDEYKALEVYKNKDSVDSVSNSTLESVQEISTVPNSFPKHMNTCGRVAVHPSGEWLLVSNRGHDSIAVYKISQGQGQGASAGDHGRLVNMGYFHTSGYTPRHFKFSLSGKWLMAANQDSDSVVVFSFDVQTGSLKLAHAYTVCSPNFLEVKAALPSAKM